jgi:hypothetical protein
MNRPSEESGLLPVALPPSLLPIAGGWQTILADLALILFMVTAAALAGTSADAPGLPLSLPTARPRPPVQASPRAEPVGVWNDAPGSPALSGWLAQQARDPRLRATILVRHTGGRSRAAMTRALALVEAAGPHGGAARIVIEQGPRDSASVLLGYDAQ